MTDRHPPAPTARSWHAPLRSLRSQRSAAGVHGVALGAVVCAAVASLTLTGVAAAAPSAVDTTSTTDTARPGHGARNQVLQDGLDALVDEHGYPGALASASGRDGRIRHYTAGVGDLETGARVPVDGQVRLGSNSKTFTAVVVLQLVGEGTVALDEPVETYLPGLVRGEGIDGHAITVRQLLQHQSGIPDYVGVLMAPGAPVFRDTYLQPRTLLDLGLSKPAEFAPGERWSYSNTNYVIAGLVIEKVTGRPLHEEITRRVIDRIGLRHTYAPIVGERDIRERHPQGYHADVPGGELLDVTSLDPGWAWAAGELVGTPSDLLRFYRALLAGRLLEPAELEQMRTTVADGPFPGAQYGLGIMRTELSCGGYAWGHGGDIDGFSTRDAVTEDGRGVVLATTALAAALPDPESVVMPPIELVDATLCAVS